MSPAARPARPQGTITRGTTHPNRLRRVDRWIAHAAARPLRDAADALVVEVAAAALVDGLYDVTVTAPARAPVVFELRVVRDRGPR